MTKFTSFDKKNLNDLRTEMNELLQKYGISANLEIEMGKMVFSSSEVEIKVTAKVKGAKTFEDEILDRRVASLGLKMKNKYGDELVEYKTRNWKMPYVYKCAADGKLYKCDENMAKLRFAA
jgi:hypothetical protein